jgi:hypothetical protein
MRSLMSNGLLLAALFAGMLYAWLAANDWDMATVVCAVVAVYAGALHLAIRLVQRWSRGIAA